MRPIRVVELFAGVGSQRMALKAEGIPHKVVAIAEIDRHALASYEAIHGDCPNLGDITKIERLPDCDLVTYSFPCQDLSLAGKRAGMGKGTRSGLVWEVIRLLEAAERRPEWLLMENVPQVLTSPLWPDLLDRLAAMGYRNKFAKLDSSRFGSAQKRVRAFMVSRLDRNPPDLPTSTDAPSRCIRDIMEAEVSEKFIKRIPLDRIKWREPVSGYHHPQSDGIVCPLIDSTVPRLENRRIAAERSLAPTLRRGTPIQIVSEEEEERARSVCDEAENLRMAPRGESSIGTVKDGEIRMAVSPEEIRRRESRIGTPGASTPCAEVEGVVYYPERSLYSKGGSAPTVCTDHGNNRIQVVDHIEPSSTPIAEIDGVIYYPGRVIYSADRQAPTVVKDHSIGYRLKVADHVEPSIKVVAEDTYRAYGASAKILSPDSTSPTLRSQAHGLQNQPKVADRIEYSDRNIGQCSKEDLIAEHFAKAKGPGDVVKHELNPFEEGSKRFERGLCSVQMEDGHLRFYSGGPGGYGYQDLQFWSIDSPSPSVTASHAPKCIMSDKDTVPRMEEGDACPVCTPAMLSKKQNGRRFGDPNAPAYTVTRSVQNGVAYPQGGDLIVRVLTPRECWRLMGFADEDYDKAAAVSSETQLYNQAGNSIVTQVLRAIFRAMFVDVKEPAQTDLTRWIR